MDLRTSNNPLVITKSAEARIRDPPFSRPEVKMPPGRRKLVAAGKEIINPSKPANATARKLIARVVFDRSNHSLSEKISNVGGKALWLTWTIF